MSTSSWRRALAAAILSVGSACAYAEKPDCGNTDLPRLSFVQFTSPNIATSPPSLLTIKASSACRNSATITSAARRSTAASSRPW